MVEYRKILSVIGMPGLFEIVSNKADGALVKSLDENKIKYVSSRLNTFTHLETIEVFTIRENVNLIEIFRTMEKSELELPSEKDPKAVKAYFEQVYPDLDFDKVYDSDMRKMVKWFKILRDKKIVLKLSHEINAELEAAAANAETVAPAEG